MDGTLAGAFGDDPVDAARAFRAALQAMARPGRIGRVDGAAPPPPLSAAAAALLLTLCDPETPLCLVGDHDCPAVRDWLTFHRGTPFVDRDEAAFAVGRWEALVPLSGWPAGTPEYPDRSATLIVEVDRLKPEGMRLTGPGIETEAHLSLPEARAFQANAALFPQGLDFFLTCGDRLAALPRTTRVEAG